MKQATIIKRLQALAEARYNQGWDTFVECYEAADWEAFTTDDDTGQPMTWRQARQLAEACASVWLDRQQEAAHYREEARAAYDSGPGFYDYEEDKRDDGDEYDPDDDTPPEPLIFIPHAADADRWPF